MHHYSKMYSRTCMNMYGHVSRCCGTTDIEYKIVMNLKQAMNQSMKNETFVITVTTFSKSS